MLICDVSDRCSSLVLEQFHQHHRLDAYSIFHTPILTQLFKLSNFAGGGGLEPYRVVDIIGKTLSRELKKDGYIKLEELI